VISIEKLTIFQSLICTLQQYSQLRIRRLERLTKVQVSPTRFGGLWESFLWLTYLSLLNGDIKEWSIKQRNILRQKMAPFDIGLAQSIRINFLFVSQSANLRFLSYNYPGDRTPPTPTAREG
jgi:hypothetical protein